MFPSAANDIVCKSLKINACYNNGRDAALRCPVGAARRPYQSGAPSDLCHPRTKNHAQRVGKPQHDKGMLKRVRDADLRAKQVKAGIRIGLSAVGQMLVKRAHLQFPVIIHNVGNARGR